MNLIGHCIFGYFGTQCYLSGTVVVVVSCTTCPPMSSPPFSLIGFLLFIRCCRDLKSQSHEETRYYLFVACYSYDFFFKIVFSDILEDFSVNVQSHSKTETNYTFASMISETNPMLSSSCHPNFFVLQLYSKIRRRKKNPMI